MSCYPEPGPRLGELLILSPDLAANGPALIRPARTDSEDLLFGGPSPPASKYKGIIPTRPAHVIDQKEWNDGECGKCGGKTPYCKRCGVTWCVDCEPQTCEVSASQEI